MSTLHTVNKSPFERPALETCLRVVRAGSAILLLEDGVYAALRGGPAAATLRAAAAEVRIYVLGPDLELRGLTLAELIGDVEVVDYNGFVALAVEHERVQSWL
jgi:tRNA 2-thiouridine synthesizing protein B